MTKGLEALENIRKEAGTPYFSSLYDIDMWREDFATVEKELKALDKYEELLEEKLHFAESNHNYIEAVVIIELLIDFENIFERGV